MVSARITLLVRTMLGFSIVGFADALYLTVTHYQGVIPPCSVVSGCETVLTSPYSILLGVPVALLGTIYYGSLLIATTLFLDKKDQLVLKFLYLFPAAGLIASLYFVSLMLFILQAFCLYCGVSAAVSTIIFALGIALYRSLPNSDTHTDHAGI